MVGGDRIDAAIGDAAQQRERIVSVGERRVDAASPVEGCLSVEGACHVIRLIPGEPSLSRDPRVAHRKVMGRDIARDPHAPILGATHSVQRSRGREVREVQSPAGLLRQGKVPLHDHELGAGRPAGQPETRGDGSGPHHRPSRKGWILCVFDQR